MTAYEMRISDWISDVCSSDLVSWRTPLQDVPVQGTCAGDPGPAQRTAGASLCETSHSGSDSSPTAIIPGLHAPQHPMSTPASPASNPRVGFVSLGCPKALVDSERILTQLKVEGYDIVQTYDDADVVVVNTCGFIDSAVAESDRKSTRLNSSH